MSLSEFTVYRWASNLGVESSVWRWLPHDERSQPLYRLGHLPDDIKVEFEQAVERAQVFLVGTDVYFTEEPGSVPATVDQKVEILDGFFWVGGASSVRTPPTDWSEPSYWAHHEHELPEGVSWISEDEWNEAVAKLKAEQDAQHAAGMAAHWKALGEQWDAKADRYQKLGWTMEDVVAEFGPRPSRPASKDEPKKDNGKHKGRNRGN